MKTILLTMLLSLATMTANAKVDKPDVDDVRKVLDYYYKGAGQGVILIEGKLCKKIAKKGPNKNNCAEDYDSDDIKLNTPLILWMSFLVPNDDPGQSIIVQFEHKGIARIAKDFTIKGSIRYRTWRKFALNKKGDWTIKIIHDKDDDVKVLKMMSVSVTEAEAAAAPASNDE